MGDCCCAMSIEDIALTLGHILYTELFIQLVICFANTLFTHSRRTVAQKRSLSTRDNNANTFAIRWWWSICFVVSCGMACWFFSSIDDNGTAAVYDATGFGDRWDVVHWRLIITSKTTTRTIVQRWCWRWWWCWWLRWLRVDCVMRRRRQLCWKRRTLSHATRRRRLNFARVLHHRLLGFQFSWLCILYHCHMYISRVYECFARVSGCAFTDCRIRYARGNVARTRRDCWLVTELLCALLCAHRHNGGDWMRECCWPVRRTSNTTTILPYSA